MQKERKMQTKEFYFDLPAELIAQNPSEKRGEDRLLLMDREKQIMRSVERI